MLARATKEKEMKTIVLAGGLGTRLQEETTIKPKPMVEIGGHPILWHIMKIYAHYGFKEFLVALGYKGEIIKSYFLNYHCLSNSLSVSLKDGNIMPHDGQREDWTVHLIDTGPQTETGGRIKRLAPWIGDETFMMTYGDGVANIDIEDLVSFHRQHGKLATVTAVRPSARFGSLEFNGNLVKKFAEKSQTAAGWINGGFFVLEPEVLEYIDGDDMIFERGPLERLASDGQLAAYKHDSFWQCMDTLRDVRLLESHWQSGEAPWKVWR